MTTAEPSGWAVVIDTNFAGRGRYSSSGLRRILRVEARGHAVVIPEVVTWEWAVHTRDALVLAQASTPKVDPTLGLTPEPVVVPSIEEVLDIIAHQIEALGDVEVWPSPQDGAVRSIRDQVLQTGIGTKKKGIRTGAADGLVLATVVEASEEFEGIVLCTNDSVLASEAAPWVDEVIGSQPDLSRWNARFKPLDDEAVELVTDFVNSKVRMPAIDDGLDLFASGVHVTGVEPSWAPYTTEFLQIDVNAFVPDTIGLHDLDLIEDADQNLALARLSGTGWMDVTIWSYNEDWELASGSDSFAVELEVPIEVQMTDEWEPEYVEVTDTAEVTAVT